MKRRKLVTTSNYWRNLDAIVDAREPLRESLLESLETVAASFILLRRLPDLGRLHRGEVAPLLRRIIERIGGGQLREVVAGELVVLYLSSPHQVSVLAVRHQKQSGYSFN